MTAAVVKLVCAGLLCAGMLTLAGGAQKELLRFGCACLMVVLLLSVLRQTQLPALDTGWYEEQVRQQVCAQLGVSPGQIIIQEEVAP